MKVLVPWSPGRLSNENVTVSVSKEMKFLSPGLRGGYRITVSKNILLNGLGSRLLFFGVVIEYRNDTQDSYKDMEFSSPGLRGSYRI